MICHKPDCPALCEHEFAGYAICDGPQRHQSHACRPCHAAEKLRELVEAAAAVVSLLPRVYGDQVHDRVLCLKAALPPFRAAPEGK